MNTSTHRSYTATGILRFQGELPVEAIGTALMDSAADVDENTSVAIDIERSVIEIEAMVTASDELDALSIAKLVIHMICDRADLPVDFADDRSPRPMSGTLSTMLRNRRCSLLPEFSVYPAGPDSLRTAE